MLSQILNTQISFNKEYIETEDFFLFKSLRVINLKKTNEVFLIMVFSNDAFFTEKDKGINLSCLAIRELFKQIEVSLLNKKPSLSL